MEASIAEANIKKFVKILQCASKFGDDLCMHANKDIWELAVTNSTKSAYFLAKLRPRPVNGEPGFFSRYKALGSPVQQRRGIKCALLAVLAVIGKASTANNVDRLDLKIVNPDPALVRGRRSTGQGNGHRDEDDDEDDVQGISTKLEIKLVCKHGVTKRHSLHLGATEFLRADVDPASTPSTFSIAARTLRDWLDHFSLTLGGGGGGFGENAGRGENQLGWLFGRQQVRVKSWEGGNRELSTEIKVHIREFETYDLLDDRVELTLPMKEFRAVLQLADSLGISITAAFSEATQPLTLTSDPENSEEGHFDIFCAIATTLSDTFQGINPDEGTGNSNSSKNPHGRVHSDLTDVDPPPIKSESRSMSRGPSLPPPISASASASGSGSISRKRGSESQPPNRARSRLSMSSHPPPSPGRIHSAPTIHNSRKPDGQEPLFLSNSQGPSDERLSNSQSRVGPSNSQEDSGLQQVWSGSQGGRQMSQREILDAAGMEDVDMEQLGEELDDAEEEEWTASQQLRKEKEGDREDDGNDVNMEKEIGETHGEPEEQQFVGDQSIWNTAAEAETMDPGAGGASQLSRGIDDDHDSTSKDTVGTNKGVVNQRAAQDIDDEEYDDEAESGLGSTQKAAESNQFVPLFLD